MIQRRLAAFCFSAEGTEWAADLAPQLTEEQIRQSWQETGELKGLLVSGYILPLKPVAALRPIFKAARLGSLLSGEQLNEVRRLLGLTQALMGFIAGFKQRCPALGRHASRLYPLPKLQELLNKSIDEDGRLLDSASDELFELRSGLKRLRQRVEKKLTELMTYGSLVPYLQDSFFTTRYDRYVLPLKLDSRGRVRGKIIDTSESGQTLFFEPTEISRDNDEIGEIELLEKLEVIRILRDLTAQIAGEIEIIQTNYEVIVHLDTLSAKARLAVEQDACEPVISHRPGLKLLGARHPLLNIPRERQVPNDIAGATQEQRVLIITGPNAGGKTIVLKTVGMIHAMAKAGLLVPCSPDSEIYIFKNIRMEIGDSQDITANLSTFSSHIMALCPILSEAGPSDLVLLDEIAVGTEPETGAAIAQAVLEEMADRNAFTVATTHFDRLKSLAFDDPRFRNGAMEFSKQGYSPTYRLLWDVPGNSYGLEMASAFGLPQRIIDRAAGLRGSQAKNFDEAVEVMLKAKQEMDAARRQLETAAKDAENSRFHWENEREALAKSRQEISRKVGEKYRERFESLETEVRDRMLQVDGSMKSLRRQAEAGTGDEGGNILERLKDGKQDMNASFEAINRELSKLNQMEKSQAQLPGKPAAKGNLTIGQPVYVLPLRQTGEVTEYDTAQDVAEVQVGAIKLKLSLRDLRVVSDGEHAGKKAPRGAHAGRAPGVDTGARQGEAIPFVMQTSTNTVDLRGSTVDEALGKMWTFIDRAMLRGEGAVVIIHGHGGGDLKRSVRYALETENPYRLRFRVGTQGEGGDGATIVQLN